jgi:hypothetical protein
MGYRSTFGLWPLFRFARHDKDRGVVFRTVGKGILDETSCEGFLGRNDRRRNRVADNEGTELELGEREVAGGARMLAGFVHGDARSGYAAVRGRCGAPGSQG